MVSSVSSGGEASAPHTHWNAFLILKSIRPISLIFSSNYIMAISIYKSTISAYLLHVSNEKYFKAATIFTLNW